MEQIGLQGVKKSIKKPVLAGFVCLLVGFATAGIVSYTPIGNVINLAQVFNASEVYGTSEYGEGVYGGVSRNYSLRNIKSATTRNPKIDKDHQLRINKLANQCDVRSFETKEESDFKTDRTRAYPLGLFDMTLDCVAPGETVTQEIVLDAVYDTTDWEMRKYSRTTEEYATLDPSDYTYKEDNGVTVIEYQITDGGPLDEDGEANGVIVDPIGPAIPEEEESSSSGGGGGSSRSSSDGDQGASTSDADQRAALIAQIEELQSTPTSANPAGQIIPLVSANISFNQPSINTPTAVNNIITFLNTYEGENLTLDGSYDTDDLQAVQRFQRKYSKEILDIWNLTEATGYVGITTRLKMNFLIKGNTVQCPVFTEYNGGLKGIFNSEEVRETQVILQELGMYTGPLTTFWSPQTNDALVTFQETFREVMLDPWNIQKGTGYKYKTTNKFLNYFAGCDTGAVQLEGVGAFDF